MTVAVAEPRLADPALPDGATLVPDGELRLRSGGAILLGGAPFSVLRLSPTGRRTVTAWFGGAPIGPSPAHQALARRLVRRGLAHLRLPETVPSGIHDLTVIVPVRDDRPGLLRTLGCLGSDIPAVLVVDDGSVAPVDPVELASRTRPPVTVRRLPRSRGPAAARQRGLAEVTTALVAFVDAGVEIDAPSLAALAHRLADPATVAVAPRVRSRDDRHLVARYDRSRSPLDLGPTESLIGPGRLVPYVPTACLVTRTAAVIEVGGFDETLRRGEDVDLVWRLGAIGDLAYVPAVMAVHPPRPSVAAMAAQRLGYGSAAAPLADRHGDAVAPARLSPWSAVVFALAVAGHPAAALSLALATAAGLRPKLDALPDPAVEAVVLAARGHWLGSRALLTAVARAWAPAVVGVALAAPPLRRRLLMLLAAAAARRLLDGPRRPADAAIDVALGIIDDAASAAGVWRGVAGRRSIRALRPALVAWPPRRSPRPGRAGATGRPTSRPRSWPRRAATRR